MYIDIIPVFVVIAAVVMLVVRLFSRGKTHAGIATLVIIGIALLGVLFLSVGTRVSRYPEKTNVSHDMDTSVRQEMTPKVPDMVPRASDPAEVTYDESDRTSQAERTNQVHRKVHPAPVAVSSHGRILFVVLVLK